MDRHLVVLEGRWFDEYNVSLKSAFDLLSERLYDTPHGYYHEQFCDARALGAITERVGAWTGARVLYLGAHGNYGGIQGSLGGDTGFVTRVQLRRSLRQLDAGYQGAFVSSCFFLTRANARFLLAPGFGGARGGMRWVAGYSEDVDVVEATALELYFLTRLLEDYEPARWVACLEEAAAAVDEAMPGLVRRLGFRIYRAEDDGSGELVAVLDPPEPAFALEEA